MSENPLTRQYFNLNADFYAGKLEEMKLGKKLEATGAKTLILKPTEKRKVQITNDEL